MRLIEEDPLLAGHGMNAKKNISALLGEPPIPHDEVKTYDIIRKAYAQILGVDVNKKEKIVT